MLKALLAMDRRLDRIAVVHMNGCRFLGQRLEIAKDDAKYVDSGDDGIVLVRGETAIKLFKKDEAGTRVSGFVNRIREDQAYREFKALSLLSSHKDFSEHQHFPKIMSTELDTCTAWVRPLDPNVEAWAVQMQYLAGAVPIGYCSRLWGLVWDGVLCFDFDRRNQNLQDLMDQLCDAVRFMSSLGIRHRDLDMCNLMVRIADLQLFILDFSRAVLPNGDERFLKTDDPMELMENSFGSRFYPEDITPGERGDIQEKYTRAYKNPLGKRAEDDPSDFRSIGIVFDKLFQCHINAHLKFGPSIDTASFESENKRISDRIVGTLPHEDSEEEQTRTEFIRSIPREDRLKSINGLVAMFGNGIYSDGAFMKEWTRRVINSAEYELIRSKYRRSATLKK